MEKQEAKKKFSLNRKAILGYGLKVVQDLLGLTDETAAKKVTLDDIKMEDAQRGKIRLEHKQSTILSEIRTIESEKRRLFTEGAQKADVREQKMLAMKIKQQDSRMRNLDRVHDAISLQISVIDSFLMIKEQEQMNKEMGLQSVFGDMDITNLITYMDQAMIDGQVNMTMLSNLVKGLESHSGMGEGLTPDADVLDIMRQMQEAREAADPQSAIETHYDEMDKKLAEKNQPKHAEEDDLLNEDL